MKLSPEEFESLRRAWLTQLPMLACICFVTAEDDRYSPEAAVECAETIIEACLERIVGE